MPKLTGSSRPSKAKGVIYLLESGSVKDIRQAKEVTNELLKYHWTYYSELARQRDVTYARMEATSQQLRYSCKFSNLRSYCSPSRNRRNFVSFKTHWQPMLSGIPKKFC